MLSSITMNVARIAVRTQKSVPVRTFFGKNIFENFKRTIPTDEEQQAGRRKEELDANARGEEAFSLEPVIPPANAGTKENPILVFLFICHIIFVTMKNNCPKLLGSFWHGQARCRI
jgi:hypothetical protein